MKKERLEKEEKLKTIRSIVSDVVKDIEKDISEEGKIRSMRTEKELKNIEKFKKMRVSDIEEEPTISDKEFEDFLKKMEL